MEHPVRVGVYLPKDVLDEGNRKRPDVATWSAIDGFRALGCDVSLHKRPDFDVDLAVMWSIYKRGKHWTKGRDVLLRRYRDRCLVLERGFIGRGPAAGAPIDAEGEYYHVGLGGLNGRADFRNQDSPRDRWDELGVTMAGWRDPESCGHASGLCLVVVCGQVDGDASIQHIDQKKWRLCVESRLREISDYPVVWRPHPHVSGGKPSGLGRTTYAVVTMNSNIGVEAAISGIHVFYTDRGSMAAPVGCTDLSQINQPPSPDRLEWACNLAYAQWRPDEMATGKGLERFVCR